MKAYLPLFVLPIVFVSLCTSPSVTVYNFKFSSGSGTCSDLQTVGYVNTQIQGTKLTFTGRAETSSPCKELTANYTYEKQGITDYVTIYIYESQQKGICIQCISSIPFQGEFNINSPQYSIKYIYKNQTIGGIAFPY